MAVLETKTTLQYMLKHNCTRRYSNCTTINLIDTMRHTRATADTSNNNKNVTGTITTMRRSRRGKENVDSNVGGNDGDAGASGKIVRGSKKKVLAASKNSTNKNKKKEDESSVTSVAVASAAATKSKAGSTDAIIKEALVKSQYSKTISPKAASTPEQPEGRGHRVHKPSAKKKALNSIQRVKEKANVDISSPVNLNMKSPTADDHDYHKENDWVQCDDCKAWHQHPKEFRGKFSGEWSCWMMKWDPLDESKPRCVKSTTTNSGDIRRRRTLSSSIKRRAGDHALPSMEVDYITTPDPQKKKRKSLPLKKRLKFNNDEDKNEFSNSKSDNIDYTSNSTTKKKDEGYTGNSSSGNSIDSDGELSHLGLDYNTGSDDENDFEKNNLESDDRKSTTTKKSNNNVITTKTSSDNADEKSMVTTEKKLTGNEAPTKKQKQVNKLSLPDIVFGIGTENLTAINDNMDSEAMKFECSKCNFPLREIQVIDDDFRVVSRNPEQEININNPTRLYGGSGIMDLYTQWIRSNSNGVIILPSSSYEYMKQLQRGVKYSKNCEIEKTLKNTILGCHKNMLRASAIIVPIFADEHYSFASVLNPSLVVDGSYRADKTRHPCILCGNSLPGYKKSHSAQRIVSVVKGFLNKFLKYHFPTAVGNFNASSIPYYELNVPHQIGSWDCLYQVMLMIHGIIRLVKNHPNGIDINIIGDQDQIESKYFSYNPTDGVKELRRSLRYLIMCFFHIRRFNHHIDHTLNFSKASILQEGIDVDGVSKASIVQEGSSVDDANDTKLDPVFPYKQLNQTKKLPAGKKTCKLTGEKKKTTHELLSEGRDGVLQKKKVEQDRRDFHGKGLAEEHPSKKEETKRVLRRKDRLVGQHAVSVRSYKDKALRRALHRFCKSGRHVHRMCRYKRADTNKRELRLRHISVLIDPICEKPDVEGEDYVPQQRNSPCRLLIGDNDDFDEIDLNWMISQLTKHRDKFRTVTTVEDVDEAIFGTNRPPLQDIVAYKKKQTQSQDNEDTSALHEERATNIIASPTTNTDQEKIKGSFS